MADSSRIILGLPNLPPDYIEPKPLWSEFLTVYRAIQNLLQGVSRYTGIDQPDSTEIAEIQPWDYLMAQNLNTYYPTAAEPITRGQMVRASAAGQVGLAFASTANGNAIGIADETKGTGQRIKIITMGLTDAVSGMVAGSNYWLSATPGAVQNLRPVAAGNIVQGLGWALDSNHLLLRPSTYFQQL